MYSSTVTVKGQIVIPVKIRKKIGLHEGTKVFFEERKGVLLIHPATPALYEQSFGLLKGGSLVSELEKTRAQGREKENGRSKRG